MHFDTLYLLQIITKIICILCIIDKVLDEHFFVKGKGIYLSQFAKLPKPLNVSRTYYGCCAGHVRHNYQYALGVKLRIKKFKWKRSINGVTTLFFEII